MIAAALSTALPLQPQAAVPRALDAALHAHDRTGFEIGRDHARFGLVPPVDHLHPGHPVRLGWEASRPVFAGRARRATGHVRRWLALRLDAWLHGRVFDELHVTPRLLRALDTGRCPVTREPLHADGPAPSQGCVVLLDPQGAYAVGNLVMLSRRAAQARGLRSWQQCLEVAGSLATDGGSLDDLDASAWRRLGTLLSFAAARPHADAAGLPLHLLPPARVHVRSPAQALQVLLTLRFTHAGLRAQLGEIARLFPDAARPALHAFMTTLLARRLSAFEGVVMPTPRQFQDAMELAWQHPLVQARWQRLVGHLGEACCEAIVRRGAALGLGGPGLRWLPGDAAHAEVLAPACALEGPPPPRKATPCRPQVSREGSSTPRTQAPEAAAPQASLALF